MVTKAKLIKLNQGMTAEEAIRYMKSKISSQGTIYYAYVLDKNQKLLGVISLRELILAPLEKNIRDLIKADVVTIVILARFLQSELNPR